ncbi:unnamed protein product [Sphenostylis stenocarpa]|uniref:PPIase cyclophilin-type domain-containing protein n=1 Tax=Sphenostylis stenocarpa TaxID=92480 RepID=A0AA86VUQ8_9FABA|nr:unnamed protein product [Sphenostylis stenocarpa]
MAKKKNCLVFMDVSIDGDPVERMVFELFSDVAPKTAENFRALCTGERGVGPNTGKALHYKGSFFHRIVKGSVAWGTGLMVTTAFLGGDFVNRNGTYGAVSSNPLGHTCATEIAVDMMSFSHGTGGESIYGSKFPDESPRLKHDTPGLLSMPVAVRDTHGSHFIITFKADPHLDRKHVVFGKLVQGHNILKKIEDVGDEEGLPSVTVKIINCGEHNEDGKKIKKSKKGRDGFSETNSHELHRGKYKKSSGDKRKRRTYYSSESDSSSDSDKQSSESDYDSDSDISSSSYTSSSSEDRRRKRKRSRKDKHRREKRREKHREKRQRKQDRRSKRKSRRELTSHTDSDESKSGNSSGGESCGARAKDRRHKDNSKRPAEGQSSLVVEKQLPPNDLKKKEKLDMLEEELPKENEERYSNGIGANYKSDRSEGRQPDVMDDQPGKSRSQSMSISPRSASKSPSSPKRSASKSPGCSGSPRAPLRRSLSRSPVRSTSKSPNRRSISRSIVRGRKGISFSRSPVRSRGDRSVSASPVRSLCQSQQRTSPRAASRRSISRSPVRSRGHKSAGPSPGRSLSRGRVRTSPRMPSRTSISRSPVRSPGSRSVSRSPVRSPGSKSVSASPVRSRSHRNSPRALSRRSISRSPVRTHNHRSVYRSPVRSRDHRSVSASPIRSLSRNRRKSSPRSSSRRSISTSPVRTYNHKSLSRSPVRSHRRKSVSASPVRSFSRGCQRSSPRAPSRRSISRSPRVSRKSISRSPIRSSARSSGRVPLRSISRSPVRVPSRGNRRSYSRSPRGRSLSKSVSPDVSPKRIRRGRGFSERYSYARRYRTPSRSPVRSYRHNGRSDRDRYSGYRRYSPRRNRSPPPRRRTPPRFVFCKCSGVGGAGRLLYHAAHVTEPDIIVEAVVLYTAVHLSMHIDLVLRGAGLCPGAGVLHDPRLQWNQNLHGMRAGTAGQGPQGPSLKAQMGRKGLFLMEMVPPIQAKGGIHL